MAVPIGQWPEGEPVLASRAMAEVLDLLRRVAPADAAVLITGESGVGKGHLASLLHRWSPRTGGPFLVVDCGSLPEGLIESELFGYEPGAFTGASREGRPGLIESAHGGTLFLDEIGELPLPLQTKLLRFLQEKTITRVGGRHTLRVDVRVIAATNRDLREMVRQGLFREDLFWRLNVIPVHVAPLRQRPEDVPVLLEHFLASAVHQFRRPCTLDPAARAILCRYPWPGNVRELENLVVRLVVTSPRPVIGPADLPAEVHARQRSGAPGLKVTELIPLPDAQEEMERQLLYMARLRCTSTRHMAELLGVNQSTVVRKLQRYFPNEAQAAD